MSQHALLSPSSAHRWLACAASVAASQGIPDTPSVHAAEGTHAHDIAAMCLRTGADVQPGQVAEPEALQIYLDHVRGLAEGAHLLVEQALDISAITGEAGARGTADAVVIDGDTLHVIDLKWGRGVLVRAERNEQLILYALGALDCLDPLGEITDVHLHIAQPRLECFNSWQVTADYLRGQVPRIRQRAALALELTLDGPRPQDFTPGGAQCRFCPARATCAALAGRALAVVAQDFADVTQELAPQIEPGVVAVNTLDAHALGRCMAAAPLVETWLKAVRGEVETRLLAGAPVPGFKLVAGRKGARKWANDTEAEDMLRAMRLKTEQMYELKLISPTSAEKLHKGGDIGPRQWPKLQALITQGEGAPSVAPDSDKRAAINLSATADDFERIEEPLA